MLEHKTADVKSMNTRKALMYFGKKERNWHQIMQMPSVQKFTMQRKIC